MGPNVHSEKMQLMTESERLWYVRNKQRKRYLSIKEKSNQKTRIKPKQLVALEKSDLTLKAKNIKLPVTMQKNLQCLYSLRKANQVQYLLLFAPEIDPHICGQLIFDKGAKVITMRQRQSFQQAVDTCQDGYFQKQQQGQQKCW